MTIDQTIKTRVISTDGTPIAVEQSGSGSPLMLVHGTGADHTRWAPVIPQLSQQFTVYCIDRRGHGDSGEAKEYSIQREYEDIAAVASAIDRPVDILGHSFGAACVLGAAQTISNLRRLILYEPPMMKEQQSPARSELIERMDQALAIGDREAVLRIMYNEMFQIPLPIIDRMRTTPAWSGQMAAAHTIPRELRSSDAYGANPDALKVITAQTMFLSGSESHESFKRTMEKLHNLLPNNQIVVLPGQQHSAMLTAPELFAREVTRFLSD
jgi:pimeloyl-ACP methyl ester carboxylesterase